MQEPDLSRFSPPLFGRIEQGHIKLDDDSRDRLQALLRLFDGKEIDLRITKHRKHRSMRQNAYYWGVVIPMIQEAAGYTNAEETHEALKWHFLQVHTGKLPTVRSMVDLDSAEATEYIDRCRQLAAEMFGINIPDPVSIE